MHLLMSRNRGGEGVRVADLSTNIRRVGKVLAPCATAIAVVLVSVLIHTLIYEQLGNRVPLLSFFPGVALAACFGGWVAGALATFLSTALVDLLWLSPGHSFAISDPGDIVAVSLFLISGLIVSVAAERPMRAKPPRRIDPAGCDDVTELKEAQIRLERARDAAETANRAKSEFLAAMSHEVRTPLNGIMGMNALLLGSDLTYRQRKMAAAIRESTESLLVIIDDILDISKLEAGRMEIDECDFNLRDLVDAAVELFTPAARDKGVRLFADTDAVLRAALRGDALRLRQILLNLISNAIKFTPNGSVGVTVSTVDESPDRTRMRVEVLDDGPGVDRQTRQRLFKPFEQADGSTSRRFGGTGLGLNICKRLVELLGGRIGMNERPEGGSAFWFEVVVGRAPATALFAMPPSADTSGEGGNARFSGRILLADDNKINTELTTMILEGAGYTVDVVVNGNEAIAAVSQRHYDLVLMDMQMPLLDGLAATRAIRASEHVGARLPIVAMTANAMNEDRRQCLESGMDDYFSKPFLPTTLIKNVSRWIDLSEKMDAREADLEPNPNPSVVSTLPIVDDSAVEGFRSIVPNAKFIELLGYYLDNLDRIGRTLTGLKSTPAIDEIGREAHKLIMGSATFGAKQVQELVLLLQSACNKGDASSVATLTESLISASEVAAKALRVKYDLTPP